MRRSRVFPARLLAALAGALVLVAGTAVPATAAAGPAASAAAYNIFHKTNGINTCLDALYAFARCQTSPGGDDPASVQRWVLVPAGGGTDRIWNRGGTKYCLDASDFDGPCSAGAVSQRWVRVSAGGGAYYIENRSASGTVCLDEFWSFKACSRGDANQIWRFRLAVG